MKRLWIGVGLMIVLLAAGIWEARRMENIYLPAAQEMEAAGDLARTGDFDGARAAAEQVQARVEQQKHLTAALTDHETLEEIDGLFSRLENCEDQEDYASTCGWIAAQLEHLGQIHSLTWWNLF